MRFVHADLFIGKQLESTFEQRSPIPVGGKQLEHIDLTFTYDVARATSNNGTLRVTVATTLGRFEFEKKFIVYSMSEMPQFTR